MIYRLNILGLNNLKIFRKNIGFLHPKKRKKLEEAIDSYVNYNWSIPIKKKYLLNFINDKGNINVKRNEVLFYSIKRNNFIRLKKILKKYKIKSSIYGPLKNIYGSIYYCLRFRLNYYFVLKSHSKVYKKIEKHDKI